MWFYSDYKSVHCLADDSRGAKCRAGRSDPATTPAERKLGIQQNISWKTGIWLPYTKLFLRICGSCLSAAWHAEDLTRKYGLNLARGGSPRNRFDLQLRGFGACCGPQQFELVVKLSFALLLSHWRRCTTQWMMVGFFAKGLSQNKSRCGFQGRCDLERRNSLVLLVHHLCQCVHTWRASDLFPPVNVLILKWLARWHKTVE